MATFDDKIKERDGYYSFAAKDYRDKGEWDILLPDSSVHESRRRGIQLASELAFILPEVLRNPTAIFMGIRWDADEKLAGDVPGWLCYVGLPQKSYDVNGRETDAYVDKVYLVFVNEDRVVYHYRWDKCCPDNPRLPMGHKTRFRERKI